MTLRRSVVVGIATRIGLLYGGAMLKFAFSRSPLHPNWWVGWHPDHHHGRGTLVETLLRSVARP
jgi:hypothetical protein